LNLVLLVLAFVLHWTFWESLIAASLVIVLYVAASLAHGRIPATTAGVGVFANNLYFLALTGIIVVTGSYFHSLSRFREFALRYELNKKPRGARRKQSQAPRTGPDQKPLFRQHQPRIAHAAHAAARAAGIADAALQPGVRR